MKLSLEQIKNITIGALNITQSDAGFDFFRLTDKQVDAFVREQKDHIKKVYANSCVRLDFYTDSKTLRFAFSDVRSGSSRTYYSFDVYENGEMIYSYFNHYTECTSDKFEVALCGDSRVQIFFPNLAAITLSDLELDDGAKLTPCKTKIDLLMHGDSITQGYDARLCSMSYANIVARRLDANVINAAIGGAVFNPEVIDKPENFTPDIVTVAYGTNDWSKLEIEVFKTNFTAFADKLKSTYPDSKIYMILPIWRGDSGERVTLCGKFADHCEYMRKEILSRGFNVIDGNDLVPHDPVMFAPDVLHPVEAGFEHYANNLIKYLK